MPPILRRLIFILFFPLWVVIDVFVWVAIGDAFFTIKRLDRWTDQ